MTKDLMNVMVYWLEGEIYSFIKIWLLAYLSISYTYFAGKILRKGAIRLAAFSPVVCLFLLLPLQLHSVQLGGTTAFFLAWLANFKLLMFAFDQGPLSNNNPSISLPKFLSIACLPIKIQQQKSQFKNYEKSHKSFVNNGVLVLLFTLLLNIYNYENYIHPIIFMGIYSCHVYLSLEIILAIAAALARGLLAAEIEPQFNKPYLSTSLQDFWGGRWNLAVTRILRPTVFLPVCRWSNGIVGREFAMLLAVISTFVVSGFMHELIFYYLGRVKPTWEITWFFLLHGACLVVEIVVKRKMKGKWQLPRLVATILTVVFVMVTGFWLFLPQLLRCKVPERGLAELAAMSEFVKDVILALNFSTQIVK